MISTSYYYAMTALRYQQINYVLSPCYQRAVINYECDIVPRPDSLEMLSLKHPYAIPVLPICYRYAAFRLSTTNQYFIHMMCTLLLYWVNMLSLSNLHETDDYSFLSTPCQRTTNMLRICYEPSAMLSIFYRRAIQTLSKSWLNLKRVYRSLY